MTVTLREDVIRPYIEAHPHTLLFLTASGAHLYGFASPDSDYDLRGAHIIQPRSLLGLDEPRLTYEVLDRDAPVEMDLVTHDIRKFFLMLLKKNGYVLEQICSPIVVHAGPDFDELRDLATRCITRHHHYHFNRFASNQWNAVAGPRAGTVKGMLYTYRPLLAGIHLMKTGRVESNIVTLNQAFGLSYIDDLVARKTSGAERQPLGSSDMAFHEREFVRLTSELRAANESSSLPDDVSGGVRDALNDLLLRHRGMPESR